MKKLSPALAVIVGALAIFVGLLAWHNAPQTAASAAVATNTGVWRIHTQDEPELVWEWTHENHLLKYQGNTACLVDGTTAYRNTDTSLREWGRWLYQVSLDWALGSGAFVLDMDYSSAPYYNAVYIRKSRGLEAFALGASGPIPVREVMQRHYSTTKSVELPIWEGADPHLWRDGQWLYSLAQIDGALCVTTTRAKGEGALHIVSDALPYQTGDGSLAYRNGRPCILRQTAEGDLTWWILQWDSEDLALGHNYYNWQQQPSLTVDDYPMLAGTYTLDLSRQGQQLLFLDAAGRLCITDLKPGAKSTILDDTLTLTADDLSQVERYGNAITLLLPDGTTRVWFPRSNLFGMTKWLTWDLP